MFGFAASNSTVFQLEVSISMIRQTSDKSLFCRTVTHDDKSGATVHRPKSKNLFCILGTSRNQLWMEQLTAPDGNYKNQISVLIPSLTCIARFHFHPESQNEASPQNTRWWPI